MGADRFFEERSDQSEVKARIVKKYFSVWANIVMPTAAQLDGKIAYIDLYAGPGRYKDGTASTPLLILQTAINNPKMAQMLVAHFNDAEEGSIAHLREEVENLPGTERLAHRPLLTCVQVDDEAADFFNQVRLVPTFSFIDPFGYKGLSVAIIRGVIKDWGCDCVFFFNYNRVNAGIGNPFVAQHMDALFGEDRARDLRARLPRLTTVMREAAILEELANEIKRSGGKYVLPFTFKNRSGTRTSHKLIFVSKHFKGYDTMKGIMADESSTEDEGVPSFSYSPADASTPLLFSLTQHRSALKRSLLDTFAGQQVTFESIYESHSVDRPYIRKNYREVLKQLEREGAIRVHSTKSRRPAGSFAPHVLIKFLARGHNGH